jgi:hypothetical protein
MFTAFLGQQLTVIINENDTLFNASNKNKIKNKNNAV